MISVNVDKYKINFDDQVISILREFSQCEKKKPEAGGIILGKFTENEIDILKLSTPTELDKATRYNFERHRLSAQLIVNYEYYNSAGEITYLGEWHTHPVDCPSPSRTDIKMIYHQLRTNKIHSSFLLLIIKGCEQTYIGIYDNNSSVSSLISMK